MRVPVLKSRSGSNHKSLQLHFLRALDSRQQNATINAADIRETRRVCVSVCACACVC